MIWAEMYKEVTILLGIYGPIKEILSEQNPAKYKEVTITKFFNIFETKEFNTSTLLSRSETLTPKNVSLCNILLKVSYGAISH